MKIVLQLAVASALVCVGNSELPRRNASELQNEPFTKFKLLGTHNSYHIRSDPYLPESYYSYDALDIGEQLDAGIRVLQFDVWNTDTTTFPVYHTEDYDEVSNVLSLKSALALVKQFVGSNAYSGEPLAIGIETKNASNWSVEDFQALNTLLVDELGDDLLFAPSNLGVPPNATLNTTWPDFSQVSFSQMTNKVIVRMISKTLKDHFDSGALNPTAQSYFYTCKKDDRLANYCKILAINDAKKKSEDIAALSEDYLIKCNADSKFVQIPGHNFTGVHVRYDDDVVELSGDWAACLMFGVLDLDKDGVATYYELRRFALFESEWDPAVVPWMDAYVLPIAPVLADNCPDLVDMYLALYGTINVDRVYTEEQRHSALNGGCQFVQTQHFAESEADLEQADDHFVNFGCGKGEPQLVYQNGSTNYCVVFSKDTFVQSISCQECDDLNLCPQGYSCNRLGLCQSQECKWDRDCAEEEKCAEVRCCEMEEVPKQFVSRICKVKGEAICTVNCVIPEPVCGVDAVTYECGAEDAHCHEVCVDYKGQCRVDAQFNDKVCTKCREEQGFVADGYECEQLKGGRKVWTHRECQSDEDCDGDDVCEKKGCCAQNVVRHWAAREPNSICVPMEQAFGGCPEYYQPVCTYAGNTYDNICFAEVAGECVACDGQCEDGGN